MDLLPEYDFELSGLHCKLCSCKNAKIALPTLRSHHGHISKILLTGRFRGTLQTDLSRTLFWDVIVAGRTMPFPS